MNQCNIFFQEGENAIDFANRVKEKIAKVGGLVDLEWDGQLKRYEVPEKLKEKQKEMYAKSLAKDMESLVEKNKMKKNK